MSNNLTIPSKRFDLALFFILVFVFSWGFWIPSSLSRAGQMAFPVPETLAGLVGAWAPSLVGLLLTAAYGGRPGIKTLLRRLLMWRFSLLLYIGAIFLPVIISLLTTGGAILLGAKTPDFAHPPITQTNLLPQEVIQAGFLILLPTMIASQILGSSLGEEMGWRGFALPRLQGKYTPLIASLIMGIVWGVWHFPRVWVPGQEFDLAGFAFLIVGTIFSAILFTWMFNASHGSLIPALILHTSQALTNQFLSVADAPAVGLVISFAIVILVVWRGMGERSKVSENSKSSVEAAD